ncbi:MAG: hypothetical protein ACOX6T_14875 [Myxococcales bacterium]|jgi:hypothetical protein
MRAPALLILAAVLGACTSGRDELPAPRLSAVSPSAGEDDAPVALTLSGDGFLPRVRTDFNDPAGSGLDDTFRVDLVPSDATLPTATLPEVQRVSSQELRATVPAGLARGFYGVRVTDPLGREAFLPEVFRVVRSAKHVAGFRFEPIGPQRVGVPFLVELTAVDAEGGLVDGFTGSVALADRTEALAPTVVGPFALGRARAHATISALAAANQLEATDDEGRSGRSEEFAVEPGLAVQVAITTAPQQLSAGACSQPVELELRDALGRPAPAVEKLPVRLAAAPPDRFTFFAGADCAEPAAEIAFAPGAARATFSFRGEKAGTVTLRALPESVPGASQAQSISALEPAAIEFVTPSLVLALGRCSSPVELRAHDAFGNPSTPAQAVPTALESQPAGALRFFSDTACANEITSVDLEPEANLARFHVRADGAGTSSIKAAPSNSLAPAVMVLTASP